jgi:hypothetical protein
MCPAHAAWPPRPCARSPSRDVRQPSNLPSHLSPLSHYQSGSVRQARLPRFAHMINLDRAVWCRICLAPSRTCSLVSELVSSVHPTALLSLHQHANAVRRALSHLWPTLHALTCSCVAPTLTTHALVHCIVLLGRHAYFPCPCAAWLPCATPYTHNWIPMMRHQHHPQRSTAPHTWLGSMHPCTATTLIRA